ncbi:MAG TPA: LLM class F420-dependent oxidoreductase, partial [Acidimicrobiia bacterium]|nr:LLM class F420-dependent oxidoreductase [Acidimicrobiia bacterium]
VVVDTDDRERARAVAHAGVKNPYLGLVNYRRNLLRSGFSEADLAGDGSETLIDALAPQGDAKTVAGAVNAHLAAGADHVCIQVLGDSPMAGYRALAEVLL